MNLKRLNKYKFVFFCLALIGFACLPVWYFQFYVNQDGSPHLYNAQLLYEIVSGTNNASDFHAINAYPVPNLTGHWIMAFLLIFFSPFVVSKLMITLSFGAVVASCGWLRWKTNGRDGIDISLLFGCVIAFNWLWFLGFYNFILGMAGFAFTLGLYWGWREELNYVRSSALALLIVFVYFSHLIGFAMLVGSILVICVFAVRKRRKQNYLFAAASVVPTLPLIISYRRLSGSGESPMPNWNYLDSIFSISSWVQHLQAADPLQLISRKAFPFIAADSGIFALFSFLLWVFCLIAVLVAALWFAPKTGDFSLKDKLPWLFLLVLSVSLWVVAPDDFGKSHGSILRERILLIGLMCFVPVFSLGPNKWLKSAVRVALAFIVVFQTAVLWEYSFRTENTVSQFMSAKPHISEDDKIGSIVFIENGCRYKPNPLTNMGPLLAIGKSTRVWDNYEVGYYLFPVVARNEDEKDFVFEFVQTNAVNLCETGEAEFGKLKKLQELLELHHQKFSVLVVWNGNDLIRPVIQQWFETEPYFQNGKVQLFRHRPPS